jgi:hypothetical protein
MLLGEKVIEGIAKKTLGVIIDPNSGETKKMARLGEIDGRVEEPVSSSNLFGKSEQDYIDQVVDRWRLFKSSLFFEKQKLIRDKEESNHKLSVSLRSEEELISNEQKKEIDLLDVEMGIHSAERKNLQEIFNSA